MERRHLFSTSQMFESEQDQNWNHVHMEQPYRNMARTDPVESTSLFYPVENMSVDGVHYASPWDPAPMPNGYISSNHGVEVSHCQPDPSGSSHDPFLHTSTGETFCTAPENYAHNASSTSYGRQAFHAIEGGDVDLRAGSGRGLHKRKGPGIPSSCERGSTSRYYGAGSSSDLSLSIELPQGKPDFVPQYMPREQFSMTPGYQGNLSLRPDEEPTRNVRSRPALDLESNLARTRLSSNSAHVSYSASHLIDHSSPVDVPGQSSSVLTPEWNHPRMSPAHGRIIVSDPTSFSNERSHFLVGSSTSNASVDSRAYQHDFILRRNPAVSQSPHPVSTDSERGPRSGHSLRNSPTFRASSSSWRLGHVVHLDEGVQTVAENYSSRQPRPLPTPVWRGNDRNGRSRISYDRYRSLSNEAGLQDRISSEGYMVVERPAFYGPRNMFDQHRDMRLDIDNMSYEVIMVVVSLHLFVLVTVESYSIILWMT
uniref:E3 ubiquitin-protein ligase MBR1 n=1 Tax=Rhizophora mucronata TaxID=61149 RepID=A0A2P2KMU2_RHIMU